MIVQLDGGSGGPVKVQIQDITDISKGFVQEVLSYSQTISVNRHAKCSVEIRCLYLLEWMDIRSRKITLT